MNEIPKDRLSLVVGVTGHRDVAPQDEAPLRRAFARVLESLSQSCRHTPLLVLSGLAPGADTFAAEEALARGIPIIACLPTPAHEYEADFSPAELVRFRSLLARSARTIVTGRTRDEGYIAVGRFITQYSHLLVAFWDGKRSRGQGGTADVIDMRLSGRPMSSQVEAIPYLPDIGPVDFIITPRIGDHRPPDAFQVKRLFPKRFVHDEAVAQTYRLILAHIDVYNVDLAQVPASTHDSSLQGLMRRTDAVANVLQARSNGFAAFLLTVGFLAAAAQVIVRTPPLAKILGLLVAFFAYAVARRHDYENRYQDYRAIAEGLRVLDAWHCAGLKHRLVDNEYLRMQAGALQWIRLALRFFYLLFCEGRHDAKGSHDHPTCRHWVRSQWRYYYRASRREKTLKSIIERISIAAVGVGIASFVVSAAALGTSLPCALAPAFCARGVPHVANFFLWQNLLTVPIVLAVLLNAILGHFAEKQNLLGSARRYERMFHVFDRARRDLAGITHGAPGDAGEVIYELGRAALVEHADWLIMRRDRPLKMVVE